MKKKSFLEGISLVLDTYSCFLQEEQILKSSNWGHSWDLVAGHPGDQIIGSFRDISQT